MFINKTKHMRNLKFLLVALCATVFCACSSDNDNSSNTLKGTTWEATEESDGTIYAEWKLSFQESTFKMEFKGDENGDGIFDKNETVSGPYNVDGNDVTLTADGSTMYGKINGTTIHFPETDESDEFTFHKK